jgi:hypothetical protein
VEQPKAFISYSWTGQQHQQFIIDIAKRLVEDGVQVIMDVFDLREGDDKYAFMERMVTDPDVTHVLAFSDGTYAQKANARQAGVGTESQILSREIYGKVKQSKILPIVCQFEDDGSPTLPTFFASRIWIDFSSDEAVNKNWEQLIRVLYNRPLHQKPELGEPPTFLSDDSAVRASPAAGKFGALRQAILEGKPSISLYRQDFLDACIRYADTLRVRSRPEVDNLAKKIVEDCARLVAVRDHITDWVLLESMAAPSPAFSEALHNLLERLCELKTRPAEVSQWNDAWFDAHAIFVFETFLYVVAALLKTSAFPALHSVFAKRYLVREPHQQPTLATFREFYSHSEYLRDALTPGKRYHAPAAEVIKRQAQRSDLRFDEIMQAELVVLMMAFITPDVRWYPQTLHYMGHGSTFPLFLRAAQSDYFKQLSTITGIESADALRAAVLEGHRRLHVEGWQTLAWNRSFSDAMNLNQLGTIA